MPSPTLAVEPLLSRCTAQQISLDSPTASLQVVTQDPTFSLLSRHHRVLPVLTILLVQ